MQTGSLYLDSPAAGSWNMAVDQVLLEKADERGELSLRFYQWCEPTLSLGYFQPLADREHHFASQSCPVVRRSTGGGAIVHDRELTYSICLPSDNRWSAKHAELYSTIHGCLISVLTEFGIAASLWMEANKSEGGSNEHRELADFNAVSGCEARVDTSPSRNSTVTPFLCFQRRSIGDLLIGNQKIGGSAQRRKRAAILQHGSILFRRSPCAPELPGIFDLQPNRIFDQADFLNRCATSFQRALELDFERREHSISDQNLVREMQNVFESTKWNQKIRV